MRIEIDDEVFIGAAVGFALRSPAVRASAAGMAKQIALGTGRTAVAGAAPFAPAVMTGAMFAAAIGLGYASGAVAGTLIAEKYWGESGKRAALDLYTGRVSWKIYSSTVVAGMKTLV